MPELLGHPNHPSPEGLAITSHTIVLSFDYQSFWSLMPQDIRDAEIISIQPITPTVKLFRLHVVSHHGLCLWSSCALCRQYGCHNMVCAQANGVLPFSPGQWVDFHAPNVAHVGGYSICSPPSQMEKSNTLDLAVKLSSYPPAIWLHKQAGIQQTCFETGSRRQHRPGFLTRSLDSPHFSVGSYWMAGPCRRLLEQG